MANVPSAASQVSAAQGFSSLTLDGTYFKLNYTIKTDRYQLITK